jgi:hypothetical protein
VAWRRERERRERQNSGANAFETREILQKGAARKSERSHSAKIVTKETNAMQIVRCLFKINGNVE